MTIVAHGHNGHNHWRKRRTAEGDLVTECSDDRQNWGPGEITMAGMRRRQAAVLPAPAQPAKPGTLLLTDRADGCLLCAVLSVIWGACLGAGLTLLTHMIGWW